MRNVMGRKVFAFISVLYFFCAGPVYAGYWQDAGKHLKRGFTNIVSSPLEIPIAMQDRHESAGYPVARHVWGFIEGSYRMLKRAGSGILDLGIAFVPGEHRGWTPDPESLF